MRVIISQRLIYDDRTCRVWWWSCCNGRIETKSQPISASPPFAVWQGKGFDVVEGKNCHLQHCRRKIEVDLYDARPLQLFPFTLPLFPFCSTRSMVLFLAFYPCPHVFLQSLKLLCKEKEAWCRHDLKRTVFNSPIVKFVFLALSRGAVYIAKGRRRRLLFLFSTWTFTCKSPYIV